MRVAMVRCLVALARCLAPNMAKYGVARRQEYTSRSTAGGRSTVQEAGVHQHQHQYRSTGVQYRRQEAEVHQHQHSRLLAHSHLQLCRVQSLMSDLPLVVDPNTNHILDFDSLPFMTRVQNVFSFRKIFATSVQAGVQFLYPCELCIVCSPCAMLSEKMIFCLVVLGGCGASAGAGAGLSSESWAQVSRQ